MIRDSLLPETSFADPWTVTTLASVIEFTPLGQLRLRDRI
jgi:hypothetical protein